jgi:hypothetical protein
MHPSRTSTAHGTTACRHLPVDRDLAEQALPGHGIPSQDPDPAAQRALAPEEAAREAHSVLVGGVVVAGAAVGTALGVALAGPVGAVVGGTFGALAGALGGAAAGMLRHHALTHPTPAH